MQCTSCSKDNECPLISSLLNSPVSGHESEVQDRAKAEVLKQHAQEISQHLLTFLFT